MSLASMLLAVWFAVFRTKLLTFQVYSTSSTVETFGVVILSHGLHPSVTRLNGKLTSSAHGLEQGSPMFFTIEFSILNVKLCPSNRAVAVST